MKTLYESIFSQKVFATIFTNLKSALWLFSLSGGVQTAENTALAHTIAFLGSIVKFNLFSL